MDRDGPGWTGMDWNGPGWTGMDRNGPGWTGMDRDGPGSTMQHRAKTPRTAVVLRFVAEQSDSLLIGCYRAIGLSAQWLLQSNRTLCSLTVA
jgi:hypothetical protein